MDDGNAALAVARVDDLDRYVDLTIAIEIATQVVRIQVMEYLELLAKTNSAQGDIHPMRQVLVDVARTRTLSNASGRPG